MTKRQLSTLIAAAVLLALAGGAAARGFSSDRLGYLKVDSLGPAAFLPAPSATPTLEPIPTSAPTPTPTPSPPPRPQGWQRGFAFWAYSAPLGSPEGLRSLRALRDLGADTVSPVVTWYVANGHDPRLHRSPRTPSDQELAAAVDEAHRLGLRVAIRLHVDCEDGTWRALIDPPDKETWWVLYEFMLDRYALFAEQHGVEGLVIGTELVSLTRPQHTTRWQSMIAGVRDRYTGFLTYSAQWGAAPPDIPHDPFREYEQIGFWRELDYLGISAYFELAGDSHPRPGLQELRARWDEWRRLRIAPLQSAFGMPLLFTEVGYPSSTVAARHPWNGGPHGPVDLALQADLYRAFFESWAGVSWFGGAYFWFWATDADGSGPNSADYPPTGKPAADVIRRWFALLDDMESAECWVLSAEC